MASKGFCRVVGSILVSLAAHPAVAVDSPGDVARGEAPERSSALSPRPGQELNFGVILETHAAPDARPAGLGYDGTHLWLITDGAVKTIWKLDPSDLSVVDSFAAPVEDLTFGLDHDGAILYGDADDSSDLADRIFAASAADGSALFDMPSPFAQPNGVVWDGADLWHSGFGELLSLLDEADGSVIRTLPSPGANGAPRDMAWDGTTLWVVDANGTGDDAIYQIDPIDGTEKIGFVPQGDSLGLMYGLAWDGKYLWLSDLFHAEIHKVELGLHVGVWLAGSCPGPVSLDIFGETPSGQYAVARGQGLGSTPIPGGDCEGIELALDDVSLAAIVTADAAGEVTLSGNLGAGFCGDYLQVVDLDTCLVSAVARLPQQ